MNNIHMPVRCISGKGCVKESSDVFSSFGKKCLIVTGKSSAKESGALDDVAATLERASVEYTVFDKISANPLISSCFNAGKEAFDFGADFIIGIGGGSVLDSCKAIAIFASNQNLAPLDIYKRVYDNTPLPVILIGTTSGTGSEVTAVSVLTNDETGIKKSIKGPDCYAKVSFMDYTYTCSMSYYQTCSTALDAFAHAVEGFFTSKCQGPLSDTAKRAISTIYECLKTLDKDRPITEEIREKLYYASIDAGFVINTCGTGFPHPLGYILTENYKVPHGMACAEFFSDFIDRCAEFSPEKFKEFVLATDDINSVKSLIKSLILRDEIKMTEAEAENYASRWIKAVPGNFTASPGSLTHQEALTILKNHFCK